MGTEIQNYVMAVAWKRGYVSRGDTSITSMITRLLVILVVHWCSDGSLYQRTNIDLHNPHFYASLSKPLLDQRTDETLLSRLKSKPVFALG